MAGLLALACQFGPGYGRGRPAAASGSTRADATLSSLRVPASGMRTATRCHRTTGAVTRVVIGSGESTPQAACRCSGDLLDRHITQIVPGFEWEKHHAMLIVPK